MILLGMVKKPVTTKTVKRAKPVAAKIKKVKPKNETEEVLEILPTETSESSEEAKTSGEDKGKERYFAAVGRRKTAIARVRLYTKGDKSITINDRSIDDYFSRNVEFSTLASAALNRMKVMDKFRTVIKVSGGGLHSQAEAVRHATVRALVQFNPDFRKRLKRAGFLTRDSRMVERKKYGLKKARRAPQWAKR